MTTEISTRVAPGTPAEADKAIRSQASLLGVGLSVTYKTIFPAGGGTVEIPTGCHVHGSFSQLPAVIRMLEDAMRPARQADIEGWLAELSVLVIPRRDDDMASEVTLVAYADRLAAYPADVAHKALLGTRWKFWPAWVELEDVCNRLAAARRVMLQAAQNPPTTSGESEEPRVRASGDATQRLMEGAGFTPKRMQALQRNRMAGPEDLQADVEQRERTPHWSETVDPDGPEMSALRKARADNPLIAAARAASERKHDIA